MARVQLISAGTPETPAYPGAVVSADAVRAPAVGSMAIAQAVGQIGQQAGELALRMAEARNQTAILDANVQQQQTFDKFQTSLANQPDETQWRDQWQKMVDGEQERIDSLHLSPDARRVVDGNFKKWVARTNAQVDTQTAAAGISRLTRQNVANAKYQAQRGEIGGAHAIVDAMVNTGLMHKDDGELFKRDLQQTADLAAVNALIADDPISTPDALKEKNKDGTWKLFPNLDPNARRMKLREAEEEASRQRTQIGAGFQNRINLALAGAGAPPTREELQHSVDLGEISPQQMKYFQGQIAGTASYADNLVRKVHLRDRINRWNPAQEDAQIQLNQIAQDMAGLPKSMVDDLEFALNRAVDSKGSAKEKSGVDYINFLFTNGYLGRDLFEDKPSKEAFATAASVQDALNRFLEQNPKATHREQIDFIDAQTQLPKDQNSSATVFNWATGRATVPPSQKPAR